MAGSPSTIKARTIPTCHPAEKHQAKGLCHKCYQQKYVAQHYQANAEKYKAARARHYLKNKAKCHAQSKDWYLKNKKEFLVRMWENTLKRNFDLTPAEYFNLLRKQKSRCPICRRHQKRVKIRFCVDHCHETKKVRGLLCSPCNRAIGQLGDTVQGVQRALTYLQRSLD